ncbi:MAG: DUF58 domain-containing protein [Verrucomicrobiota bacterium]
MAIDPPLQDPDLFLVIEDLDLVSRTLVDGLLSGSHRSRGTGGGTEFHGYRDYVPGDDLRRVDWNLWARTDRLCTRVMRAETNMPVYLLLDASGSMRTGNGPCRKWSWAARAAAALGLCALRGRDPAGLMLLTDRVTDFLPAKLGAAQFPEMLALLERSAPDGRSGLNAALHEARTLCGRRGVVILLSDLFTPDAEADRELVSTLGGWRAAGHDVLVLHLLDPAEAVMPKHGRFLTRDLETAQKVRTDAGALHEVYNQVMARWRGGRQSEGEGAGVDWLSVTTADPLLETLAGVLARRSHLR